MWKGDEKYSGCSSQLIPVSVGGAPLPTIIESVATITVTEAIPQLQPNFEALNGLTSSLPTFLFGFIVGIGVLIVIKSRVHSQVSISRHPRALAIISMIALSLSITTITGLIIGYGPLVRGIQMLNAVGMHT